MTMMTCRPFTGEPLIAPTTQRAQARLDAFLVASGAMIDTGAARHDPILTGCYVAPYARFVAAVTSCDRPLVFPEAQLIGQASSYDMMLLRFDAVRGASFDMLFQGRESWLCRYLAWRRRDGDLWLIPSAGPGSYVRVCAWGLEQVDTPPFSSLSERKAGIILATSSPSFEGSI